MDVHRKENVGSTEKAITIYGQPENCTKACAEILKVMREEAKTAEAAEGGEGGGEGEAEEMVSLKVRTRTHTFKLKCTDGCWSDTWVGSTYISYLTAAAKGASKPCCS